MTDRPALIEAETNLEEPYDTSSPEQVNAARKKSGRKRRDDLSVVGALMETRQGRAWIYGKLAGAHIWQQSFIQGSPDGTAFREGERNQGLQLLAEVQAASPQEYVTMCEEAAGRV